MSPQKVSSRFGIWLSNHDSDVQAETKYIPNKAIRSLTSAVFWFILMFMGVFMLPQDLTKISESSIPFWFVPHIVLRISIIFMALWFIYRSVHRKTSIADFYFFIILGLIYAMEGSLFNSAYYLSFIQITVGVAWFSTLPMSHLIFILPITGMVYCLSLVFGFELGLFSYQEMNDIFIATGLAIVGSLVAGFFRDYWQSISEKLLQKQVETNQRLIDLGKHLGMISHDINNLIGQQKMAVELLSKVDIEDTDKVKSKEIMTTVVQCLTRSTDHIFTLQKCVLSMSRNDPEALDYVNGKDLNETISMLVPDFCPEAKLHLQIEVDQNQLYYCAPYALSFALANAVNNSFEAAEKTLAKQNNFTITLLVHKDIHGNMIAQVKDNGPGFPAKILESVFSSRQSMGKDVKSHLGMGLHNIARYVKYQGGTVNVFNDEGAVVFIKIPFAKA